MFNTTESFSSIPIEAVVRSGIAKFTDEVGRLWLALADHYIRLGEFDKARDIFEEALNSVSTVHDFGLIFEGYQKYLETLVEHHMNEADARAENEKGGKFFEFFFLKTKTEIKFYIEPLKNFVNDYSVSLVFCARLPRFFDYFLSFETFWQFWRVFSPFFRVRHHGCPRS
jgi:hypothetical protein